MATLAGFNQDGMPVSYGHLDVEDETVWLGICVTEKEQGKGYGHDMMQELVDEDRQQNVSSVQLTVSNANATAIRLYEKFGFELQRTSGGICWYYFPNKMRSKKVLSFSVRTLENPVFR